MSKGKLLWLAVLTVTLFTTVLAIASIRNRPDSRIVEPPLVSLRQNPIVPPTATGQAYVRVAQLGPQLRWHLKVLGDRLEKPGKERLTLTGTFSRSGDAQPGTFVMIAEFPDRLRFTLQQGVQTRVITFNGQQAKALGRSLEAAERDLIETLAYDTAEHFFSMRVLGQPMQFLGSRFSINERLSANNTGPYYDLYQIGDLIKPSPDLRQQAKIYYFNSDTLLLERVRYKINSGGSEVLVEVLIGDWRNEHTNQIARRIERIENGKSVFVLTIGSVGLSTRVDDGIFGG